MAVLPSARDLIGRAYDAIDAWEGRSGPRPEAPALAVEAERLDAALDAFLDRLTAPPVGDAPGNYPFHHPRYAGQMLKPPHPVALAAYAAAARINPNNHALDGGPPTAAMEKEVVGELAAMLGFPARALGHLTGGGTVANLEALFVAREETGGRAIAASADAHYTHARMAGVLGVPCVSVATDDAGRVDLDALRDTLRAGDVGTVVLTATTTGLGAVDPIADAVPICREHGARVHVDAAYGGFFRLLASSTIAPPSPQASPLPGGEGQGEGARPSHRAGGPTVDASSTGAPRAGAGPLGAEVARHLLAIADADSVVVDPHKHGLQPYGCGAVLFRDPAVGRHYRHDSPYTYFTSSDLHLGEISLECSRPGAAAAALWLTLRALPLRPDGLGAVLACGLRAARDWAARIEASGALALYTVPETDIVVYLPAAGSIARVDAASQAVFDAGMTDPDDPVFLSLYRLPSERLRRRFPQLAPDAPVARVLRSVLMKPEHEPYVPHLHDRVEALAAHALSHGR